MKIGKIEIENENSTLNSCLLIGVFELNFNEKYVDFKTQISV